MTTAEIKQRVEAIQHHLRVYDEHREHCPCRLCVAIAELADLAYFLRVAEREAERAA